MEKYEIVYHIADLCCDNNGWKMEFVDLVNSDFYADGGC